MKLRRCEFGFGWFLLGAAAVVLLLFTTGCASLYQPAVDYALERASAGVTDAVTDAVGDTIREMAEKPVPPIPPAGSSLTEYGVWAGTVLMGSLAVLVDRRWFHNRKWKGV